MEYITLYEYFKLLVLDDLSSSQSVEMSEIDWSDESGNQIIGAIALPLLELGSDFRHLFGSDFKHLFNRYKRLRDILSDVLLPFLGLFNIVKGLLIIVLAPVVLALSVLTILGRILFFNIPKMLLSFIGVIELHHVRSPLEIARLALSTLYTTSAVIEGLATIIRGTIELIASPFAWIKVVVLGTATAIKGYKKIEEDSSIIETVDTLKGLLTNAPVNNENKISTPYKYIRECLGTLHDKYHAKLTSGRKTDIRFFQDKSSHSLEDESKKEEKEFIEVYRGEKAHENEYVIDRDKLKKYIDHFDQHIHHTR